MTPKTLTSRHGTVTVRRAGWEYVIIGRRVGGTREHVTIAKVCPCYQDNRPTCPLPWGHSKSARGASTGCTGSNGYACHNWHDERAVRHAGEILKTYAPIRHRPRVLSYKRNAESDLIPAPGWPYPVEGDRTAWGEYAEVERTAWERLTSGQ